MVVGAVRKSLFQTWFVVEVSQITLTFRGNF